MFKKNLNRKILAKIIHQNIGFSKIISENIVKDIFYIIISGFKENEKVKVTSFGTFLKKKKINGLAVIRKPKKKKLYQQEKLLHLRLPNFLKIE